MHGIAGVIVFLSIVVIIGLGVGVNVVKNNPYDWKDPSDRS